MLSNEAMIVKLSISQWSARKLDKQVTKKVNEDYGAREDAGRYNKVLVDKEAILPITKAVSALRGFHDVNTLPWDDTGARLLPVANFDKYSAEMRKLGDAFDRAVEEFIDNYLRHCEEARGKLNTMFKESDYPSVYDIRRRYDHHVSIEPVPLGSDFRVTLQAKDAQRIKKEIDDQVKGREVEAMKDLFLRIHKVVGHYVERLDDPDAKFKDSLVDNLVELVELLPRLNVTNNPSLTKLTKDATDKLLVFSPENLRTDPEVRSKAVDNAKAILDKMSGYTG
jgi:hypothetical protein